MSDHLPTLAQWMEGLERAEKAARRRETIEAVVVAAACVAIALLWFWVGP